MISSKPNSSGEIVARVGLGAISLDPESSPAVSEAATVEASQTIVNPSRASVHTVT
jgi:hypothetical protein